MTIEEAAEENDGKDKNSQQRRGSLTIHHVTDMRITDSVHQQQAGIYTGSFDSKTQKPHGEGQMIYSNGIRYEGKWFLGEWSGFGRLHSTTYDGGACYQGVFLDHKKHGLFVVQYSDGRVYDGMFELDQMGKGTMTYENGESYWGYWDDEERPHGRGKFQFADGRVYDGEFVHGEIEGHGRMTWEHGRWYLGEWSNGKRYGIGLEVYGKTIIHEGTWCEDRPVIASSFPNQTRRLVHYRTCAGVNRLVRGRKPVNYILPGWVFSC
jgi:hypothetical protein